MTITLLQGDCRDILPTLPDQSVYCVVTSPPYFGLRDYSVEGQIGLEPTPDEFVAELVAVFREVRRVLRDDGTVWLNLGDSYASQGGTTDSTAKTRARELDHMEGAQRRVRFNASGIKPKDLIGIPWRVAFALQSDGWFLRQDIIWAKPNPMPESVTDRCTKSHEYVFLLSKSARYFYDQAAIAEPVAPATIKRLSQDVESQKGSDRVPGKINGAMKAVGRGGKNAFRGQGANRNTDTGPANRDGCDMRDIGVGETRNARSVWTIATQPFKEAHFATFPPELAERCIKAGCPKGGTVLDPFGGAGTTGLVADRLQRDAILIELNPDYAALAKCRIEGDAPLFAREAA